MTERRQAATAAWPDPVAEPVMSWTLSTLNLNGMRSAVNKGFRTWRSKSRSDVLALQELRMQAGDMGPEHRAPRGWNQVQSDAEKKGYSGTAVWGRLPVRGSSSGCGLDWADREGRISRLDLEPASVVSVYLPSGSSGEARQAMKEAFMAHFLILVPGPSGRRPPHRPVRRFQHRPHRARHPQSLGEQAEQRLSAPRACLVLPAAGPGLGRPLAGAEPPGAGVLVVVQPRPGPRLGLGLAAGLLVGLARPGPTC